MKNRIKAQYFEDAKVSVARFNRGGQEMMAYVELREEDMDIVSKFIGCRFAEYKLAIKIQKANLKDAKQELKILTNLYNGITKLGNFASEEHTKTAQFIRKQIKIKTARVEELQELVAYMKDVYPDFVINRLQASRDLLQQVSEKNA